MSDVEQPRTGERRPLISVSGLLVFFLGVAVILAALMWGGRQLLGGLGGGFSNAVSGVFQAVFHVTPKTTIQSGATVIEKAAISELAVTQRKMRTVVTYKQAWLGSTKVLVVQGDFLVKAGFDLNHSFRFTTNEATRDVIVDLSRPKILSTDFIATEVLYSSDGIINKLNPHDSTEVVRQMLSETKLQAQQSDMLAEASQQVEQRIKDMLHGTAGTVTVRFHDGPLPPAAPVP
jgi:hypothetical protein